MSKIKLWGGCFRGLGPSQHKIIWELVKEKPDNFEIVKDFSLADVTLDLLIGDPDRKNLVHPAEKEWNEELKFRAYSGLYRNIYFTLCNPIKSDFFEHVFNDSLLSATYIGKDLIPVEVNDDIYFRTPLGVNAGEFPVVKDQNSKVFDKIFMIYAFGSVAETESIDVIFEAIREASAIAGKSAKMLHSGRDFGYDHQFYQYVEPSNPNDQLAVPYRYTISYFCNCLRKDALKEGGFELGNLEAPLSGCRPITFDSLVYKHWFEKTSLFVDPNKTKEDLVKIFTNTLNGKYEELYAPTVEHKSIITKSYSWHKVSSNFWAEVQKRI